MPPREFAENLLNKRNMTEQVSTEDFRADSPMRRQVTRENRKPFGSTDQKLAWPPRPGYHQHWFNDDPGRVFAAKEAGYEHVQDHAGRPVSRVVGTAAGGGPLLGYLMEISLEWYQEDMARQQRLVDDKMNAIKRGFVDQKNPKDTSSFYAGSDRGQIDIRDGIGRMSR